jgi:hypothetical protein
MGIKGTGMYCTCGKELVEAGMDNGCRVLVCPVEPKKSYRLPINEKQQEVKKEAKSWF